jgi:sRNA-binding regulator protein Hfq
MNRKLIRPNLAEYKGKKSRESGKKRASPSYDTAAENYYYLKQMNKKTPVAIVFPDGEIIEGFIEWYDRNCIKLNRKNAPNLLVYKSSMKYLYKVNSDIEMTKDSSRKKATKSTAKSE